MNRSLFLYTGLSLLLVSIIIRRFGVSAFVWMLILSIAILLKVIFLINIIRSRKFKISLGLILIFIGVTMMLISTLFKYVFPVLWLRNILFYGAITLKISGLIISVFSKQSK